MVSKKQTPPDELMIVNDIPGEECRIAILENNQLEELYSERAAAATKVGNIYKGRVVNVEPAIQAAFIDYGEGANGFLHISDLHPRYFPGAERVERVGRKIPRRERPPIQAALKRGDHVLVQVLKEGLGTKGPTLTSYLSIPGRLLVGMPDMDRVGVSRKVEDEEGRREMRKVLDSLDLPEGFGFILRTAGVGKTKTDLKRDVAYLMRLWKVMDKRIQHVGAPCELYTESDLLIRTVRDVLRPDIQAIVVDSESAFERISGFLRVIAPRSSPEVVRYRRSTPIFHAFGVERQIEQIHSRDVPLPSGGRLVIDQTEALVAIDVNSGRSRSARDSETNAYQTNCEAVDEICRQLRLRDLGGLIIHDLIDMRAARHRRLIQDRFAQQLKRDRARSTILPISEFGLVEMTRQRMRPSMRKSHYVPCAHCAGQGELKAPESVAADVTRHVAFLVGQDRVRRIVVGCSAPVASVLLSRKRRELVALEDRSGKTVDVRVNEHLALDGAEFYAYDDRNADIDLSHVAEPPLPTLAELEAEDAGAGGGKGAGDAAAAAGAAAGRKRRRRRRGGPADATSIALAATAAELEGEEPPEREPPEREPPAEQEQEQETAAGENGRKRSRRRRRRRRGSASEPEAAAVEAARPPQPVRVHELARELGVSSRELLQRCGEEAAIELKNHMSSVTAEVQETIRSLFARPAGEPETAGEEGSAAPRARRRRRRGGRRRGRGGGKARDKAGGKAGGEAGGGRAEAQPEERGTAEEESPLAAAEAVTDRAAAGTKKRGRKKPTPRRRTLYASRRPTTPTGLEPTGEASGP